MRKTVVVSLIVISLVAYSQGKKTFDKKKGFSEQIIEEGASSDNVKTPDLIRAIKGYNMLMKTETNPKRKIGFILSQNSTYLSLIKNLRRDGFKGKNDKKNEEYAQRKVIENAAAIIKSNLSSDVEKSRAAYQSGIVYSYNADGKKASEMFLYALKLNPESSWSTAINIFIAEYQFETEKYNDAIKQFMSYFKYYSAPQKALVLYKVAWAYHNLEKFTEAEKYLLSIVNTGPKFGFYDEALKDLAYMTTLHQDELNIILFSKKHFSSNPELRMDFLIQVFKYFYQQSASSRRPALYEEILTNERRVDKKLEVLLISLRALQREYASYNVVRELKKIEDQLTLNKVDISQEKFKTFFKEFEVELLTVIKSYIETYTGKTKSPENLSKNIIAAETMNVISMHLKYYPKSPEKEKTYAIWLDLCNDQKASQCKYNVSKMILSDPQVPMLHERAFAQLIIAADQIRTETKGPADELIKLLETFCDKTENQKKPDWVPYAKKLTTLYSEKNMYEKSLPYLITINSIEKNSESFYRIIFAYFKLNLLDKIVAVQSELPNDEHGKSTKEIIRESHLKLANEALQKNNFTTYQAHLNSFIKMSSDVKKIESAQLDLLSRLVERNEYEQAFTILSTYPAEKRFTKDYQPHSERLLVHYLSTGDFVRAKQYFGKIANVATIPGFELYYLLTKLALGEHFNKFDENYMRTQNNSTTNAIYTYMSILSPDKTIDLLDGRNLTNSNQKKYLFIALQFAQKIEEPDLSSKQEKILQEVIPKEMLNMKASSVEKKISSIKLPNYKLSTAKLQKQLLEALQTIRGLRVQVINEIKNKPLKAQVRIVTSAKVLELKTADYLQNSPLPKELTPEEAAQYKAGLDDISKEFLKQAEEYQKLLAAIEERMSDREINKYDFEKIFSLFISSYESQKVISEFISNGHFIKALVTLDFWHLKTGKTNLSDYYTTKFVILYKYQNTPLVKEMILAELKDAKLTEIEERLKRKKEDA